MAVWAGEIGPVFAAITSSQLSLEEGKMTLVLSALACQEINVHQIRQNKSLYELGGDGRSKGKLCLTTLSTSNCLYGRCWHSDMTESLLGIYLVTLWPWPWVQNPIHSSVFWKMRPASLMLLEMEVYYCTKKPRKCELLCIYSHIVACILCCSYRFTSVMLQMCSQNMGICSWQGFELKNNMVQALGRVKSVLRW